MKRLALLFTAALMVLSFGLANAQDVADIVGPPTGSWNSGANVNPNQPITWTIHFTVATANVIGGTNGFEIYVASDALGTAMVSSTRPDTTGFIQIVDFTPWWDGGFFLNSFSNDGIDADTVGFGGFSLFKAGIPVGTDLDVYTITTEVTNADIGNYLCIDSAYYPPGGAWLWALPAAGQAFPFWGGPYCYLIDQIPNVCPVINNGPGALAFDHCNAASFDFDATDDEGNPITYVLVSGPGSINAASGVWSYAPTLADVGAAQIVVEAHDTFNPAGTCAQVVVDLTFENQAPTIACQGLKSVGKGNSIDVQITADDVDCDPGSFSIAGVMPAIPVGSYSISAGGLLTFNSDDADGGTTFTFEIVYSDGDKSATCFQEIEVLITEPYEIQIEKTHGTFQGGHEYVDITVNKGSEAMWGFDLLIAYDASALSFQNAQPGSIYAACGWEYFTYRYGADGNCSGSCPSGLLRVVGIAETNNGANHPSCFDATGHTLAVLDFLVTDDRTFECMYVPIRFFWMDCGDNAISFHETADPNPYTQTLGISKEVYDYDNGANMADFGATFPTYLGAPDICLAGDKDVPVRFVNFYNGGIDIVCADSIDARGDLNLNGIDNEIADVVLYSNYFVYGIGVFTNLQAQIAASDVNADGLPLSVADLVYLTRIVVGDALPYPKTAPIAATVNYDGSVVSVNEPMGAMFATIEGNVAPELLATNMEMLYAFDAANNETRVLVFSQEAGQTFEGRFLNANGNVKSIELATYEGQPVTASMVPTQFTLNQNYPNPFNPTTMISFGLATDSKYSVKVYNVAGQMVDQINGQAEAGLVEVSIDGSNWASGIYFYSVEAGQFSATKKMVLLK